MHRPVRQRDARASAWYSVATPLDQYGAVIGYHFSPALANYYPISPQQSDYAHGINPTSRMIDHRSAQMTHCSAKNGMLLQSD